MLLLSASAGTRLQKHILWGEGGGGQLYVV